MFYIFFIYTCRKVKLEDEQGKRIGTLRLPRYLMRIYQRPFTGVCCDMLHGFHFSPLTSHATNFHTVSPIVRVAIQKRLHPWFKHPESSRSYFFTLRVLCFLKENWIRHWRGDVTWNYFLFPKKCIMLIRKNKYTTTKNIRTVHLCNHFFLWKKKYSVCHQWKIFLLLKNILFSCCFDIF